MYMYIYIYIYIYICETIYVQKYRSQLVFVCLMLSLRFIRSAFSSLTTTSMYSFYPRFYVSLSHKLMHIDGEKYILVNWNVL